MIAIARVADCLEREQAGESEPALRAVQRRLHELAPHVDAASSALVIRGSAPDGPSERLSLARRIIQPLQRKAAPYALQLEGSKQERKVGAVSTEGQGGTVALTPADGAATSTLQAAPEPKVTDREPTKWALVAAALALGIWAVLAIVMMVASFSTTEIEWSRLIWVFSSIEAVAFAAAGVLFGTTVNRQRAEQADARAGANERDATAGRPRSGDQGGGAVGRPRGGPQPMSGKPGTWTPGRWSPAPPARAQLFP